MQTFLPYADFAASARVLDLRRLGKQRVETLQIIRALTRPTYGWQHHPAVLMWRGYEEALGAYGAAMVKEWTERGRADTTAATMRDDLAAAGVRVPPRSQSQLSRLKRRGLPPWLGDPAFHLSHRAALMRKEPTHYAAFFDDVGDGSGIEYVWPVRRSTAEPGRAPG